MKSKYAVALIIVLAFLAQPAAAKMYKWVDENGVMHFSDTPPASQAVETIETPAYKTPPKPGPPPRTAQPSGSPQKAGTVGREKKRSNQVDLYVTSWCRYCKDAKSFFRSRGIAFNAYDIEKDEAARKRMRKLGGTGGVPFARINGNIIKGFNPAAYQKALR